MQRARFSPRLGIRLTLLILSVAMAAWLGGCGRREQAPTAVPPTQAPAATATSVPTVVPTAAPTDAPTAAPTTAPAAEASAPLSPLASPLATPLPAPTAVPAISSSEGTGVITGRLLLILEDGQVVPVPDVIMAAAEVLKDDQGAEKVVGYDRISSPKDQTDENGFFAIVDVPPGRYGLILDTVMTSFLLSMPDRSGDMLVTIEPGTQADMGELAYDMLPLVNQPPGAQ